MYLIIIFIIVVIFYLNRKSEGFWIRGRSRPFDSIREKIKQFREKIKSQNEQRLQHLRNIFLNNERKRKEAERKRLEEQQLQRRLIAQRLERERIQAKLDEERRLRLIEEQKELDRISKEESKGILTSYSYINLL